MKSFVFSIEPNNFPMTEQPLNTNFEDLCALIDDNQFCANVLGFIFNNVTGVEEVSFAHIRAVDDMWLMSYDMLHVLEIAMHQLIDAGFLEVVPSENIVTYTVKPNPEKRKAMKLWLNINQI